MFALVGVIVEQLLGLVSRCLWGFARVRSSLRLDLTQACEVVLLGASPTSFEYPSRPGACAFVSYV